jgi:hypothetical protein
MGRPALIAASTCVDGLDVYDPNPPRKRQPALDLLERAMAAGLAVVAGIALVGMWHKRGRAVVTAEVAAGPRRRTGRDSRRDAGRLRSRRIPGAPYPFDTPLKV